MLVSNGSHRAVELEPNGLEAVRSGTSPRLVGLGSPRTSGSDIRTASRTSVLPRTTLKIYFNVVMTSGGHLWMWHGNVKVVWYNIASHTAWTLMIIKIVERFFSVKCVQWQYCFTPIRNGYLNYFRFQYQIHKPGTEYASTWSSK